MKETLHLSSVLLLWLLEHGLGIPMLSTIGVPARRMDTIPWGWIVGAIANDLLGGYRIGSTLTLVILTFAVRPLQKNILGIVGSAVCLTAVVTLLELLSGTFHGMSIAIFCALSIGGPLWAGKRRATLVEIG